MTPKRSHFAPLPLSLDGLERAQAIDAAFNACLDVVTDHVLVGRELALVMTKLEEAHHFAIQGVRKRPPVSPNAERTG